MKASWAPDGNYPFLVKSLQMYNVAGGASVFLYAGIIILSGISCYFWLRAALSCPNKNYQLWLCRANQAFVFTLAYWLLFFLADQLIMNFDLEQNHMVQGGFELLCYLAVNIVPHHEKSVGQP